LRAADGFAVPATLAEFALRLAALGDEGVPLLVFRLPALERTAWRRGLRAARSIERRAGAAFGAAAVRVVRGADLIAHDAGTDAFIAALAAPTRDGHRWPAPVDVRSALARIAAKIEGVTALDVETGWTRYEAANEPALDAAIARALVRGSQERERYAFFSAVGHELRTPLASICGYLETLLSGEPDRATRERFVRIAHTESLRMTRLLEGMFEVSLLDLSASFALPARGLLDRALAGAAVACARGAAKRAVTMDVPVLPETPVGIDADRLTLVLINLIDNAIKHGRRGGRVEVCVCDATPRTVLLTVDDDGPGLAAAQSERIFALGVRGSTAADGSGIGLALVRMILERAGARIEADKSPLGGARFAVTLPRDPIARPVERLVRKPVGC
jgi:signal transduction histidine kinase